MAPTKTKKSSESSSPAIKNPYKMAAKKTPSPSKPHREKIEKGGNSLQRQGDIVYVIRLKQKMRVAYVVKGNNRSKGAYIQHLVNLIQNGDDSVASLRIDAVVPRRVPDGSNNRMMDGTFAMRQFLQVLNEDDDESPEAARIWGTDIAKMITNLNKTSQYPTVCTFGGDLTPATGPPTVDTHLLNADVVNVASHLYNNAIIDGSFFEPIPGDENDDDDESPDSMESLSAQFFGSIDDPRVLFISSN